MSLDAFIYSLGFWDSSKILAKDRIPAAKREFHSVFKQRNFQKLADYYKAISIDLQPVYSMDDFYASTFPAYLAMDGLSVKKVVMPLASVCHVFTLPPMVATLGLLNEFGLILLKFSDKTGGLISPSRSWLMWLRPDPAGLYSWPTIIRESTTSTLSIKSHHAKAISRPEALCHDHGGGDANYSSAVCMTECQNQLLKEAISCQAFWLLPEKSETLLLEDYCNHFDFQMKNSTLDGIFKTEKLLLSDKLKMDCFSHCSRSCEKTINECVLIGENIAYIDTDLKKKVDASRNSNMSITAIYFLHDALHQGGVISTEEVSAYSFTELVNNVGGTLGLFVGGTVMTFAQIILFLISYLSCGKRKDTKVQDWRQP